MRERYIPAIIMLIAGTVTCILNIFNNVERIAGLKRLLLILVIFYFVGLIAKGLIKKALNIRPNQEEDGENHEEEEEKLQEDI